MGAAYGEITIRDELHQDVMEGLQKKAEHIAIYRSINYIEFMKKSNFIQFHSLAADMARQSYKQLAKVYALQALHKPEKVVEYLTLAYFLDPSVALQERTPISVVRKYDEVGRQTFAAEYTIVLSEEELQISNEYFDALRDLGTFTYQNVVDHLEMNGGKEV